MLGLTRSRSISLARPDTAWLSASNKMTKFLPVLLYLSVVSYVTSKPTLFVKDVGCNDRDTDTKCYYCSSHYDRPELYEKCCNDVAFQDHCKTEIWVELKRESMW